LTLLELATGSRLGCSIVDRRPHRQAGVLGILIGGAISTLARKLASIPATVSPFWVVAGVATSVGVGLFFGYYPANRAANLDPIVCLRYE
jgi:putative ABC transport system permease protein